MNTSEELLINLSCFSFCVNKLLLKVQSIATHQKELNYSTSAVDLYGPGVCILYFSTVMSLNGYLPALSVNMSLTSTESSVSLKSVPTSRDDCENYLSWSIKVRHLMRAKGIFGLCDAQDSVSK